MHVVCVNYYYDRRLTSAQELLTTYRTLTGWAEGLRSAGAQVSVVQRFGREETVRHNGILYRFVADPMRRAGLPADRASRINRAVVALQPDVVHVNGLYFAYQAWRLKRMLPRTPMILQDHKIPPPSNPVRFWTLRAFLSRLDAVTFVAKEQAQPWRETGILRLDMPLYELMESSSRFCLGSQVAARACTGLNGDPLCLWVGRLNSNKDPLTVLE